jgi:NADPH2:quinone reductase
MKAIGFKTSLPITENESFIEFETAVPQPRGGDILVKIKAIRFARTVLKILCSKPQK